MKCKCSLFTTVLMELCNCWQGGGLRAGRATFRERFCTRQRGDSLPNWRRRRLMKARHLSQRCHPPPVLGAQLLFWARAAHTTPSFNSLAGSYSPVQPLITSGGRLVGQPVMWRSRAAEYWTVKVCVQSNVGALELFTGPGHCPSLYSCTGTLCDVQDGSEYSLVQWAQFSLYLSCMFHRAFTLNR